MTYFVILTLQLGSDMVTVAQVVTFDHAATRSAIYRFTVDQVTATSGPSWKNATTTFFSADPDNPDGSPS